MATSDIDIGPGTVTYEVLQYLREHGEQSTPALAAGVGRSIKRFARNLEPAVVAGALSRREIDLVVVWSVGPNCDMLPSVSPQEDVRQITKVSAMAAPSIFAYADQRNAAAFSTALHTDGRLSIERHGRLVLELTNAERQQLIKTSAQGVAA